MKKLTTSLLLLTISLLRAQEPATHTPAAPTSPTTPEQKAPAIQKIDDDNYLIGKVRFNKATRTITLPATVNILDAPLEYVLVLEKGKNHESLFTTDILPFNLNLALKLLNYQASQELFPILDEQYRPTKEYHQVSDEIKAAARANLFVAISQPDKTTKELPLNGLILLTATKAPISPSPWIYSGSYVHEGKFKADLRGNIISILEDNSSLFNCPLDNRTGDRLWIANKKHLPPFGTPIQIVIKPAPAK